MPGLIYSSFNFQIKPPFLRDDCPDTLNQFAMSYGMSLLHPAWQFFPTLGSFAIVCFIPDFPVLTTDCMRAVTSVSPQPAVTDKVAWPPAIQCLLRELLRWKLQDDHALHLGWREWFSIPENNISRIDCKINFIQSGESENRERREKKEHECMGFGTRQSGVQSWGELCAQCLLVLSAIICKMRRKTGRSPPSYCKDYPRYICSVLSV